MEDGMASDWRERERGIFIPPMSDLSESAQTIGLQIKLSRLQGFISQEELATAAGISRQNLSLIERGIHKPWRKTLIKITEALEKLSPKYDKSTTSAKRAGKEFKKDSPKSEQPISPVS
jgi:transcriptional regulator with XRE-family HTH domain